MTNALGQPLPVRRWRRSPRMAAVAARSARSRYTAIVEKLVGDIEAGGPSRWCRPSVSGGWTPTSIDRRVPDVAGVQSGPVHVSAQYSQCWERLSIVGLAREGAGPRSGWLGPRPIAGTRWRAPPPRRRIGCSARDLLEDERERAEHLMLVDLEPQRSGPGLRPREPCASRDYSPSSTTTSCTWFPVTGMLPTAAPAPGRRDGLLRQDALSGTQRYDHGTHQGRRPAAASTAVSSGTLDFAGDADFAIAIRTALMRDGTAYVRTGGGVVADSNGPYRVQRATPRQSGAPRCRRGGQTLTAAARLESMTDKARRLIRTAQRKPWCPDSDCGGPPGYLGVVDLRRAGRPRTTTLTAGTWSTALIPPRCCCGDAAVADRRSGLAAAGAGVHWRRWPMPRRGLSWRSLQWWFPM